MFTCQCRGGVCFQSNRPMSDGVIAPTPSSRGNVKLPLTLSAPVGEGPKAKNLYSDVATIQRGLDALLPGDRGSVPILKVDGICGPKTKSAIYHFQLKWFGVKGADRLIEPDRQTIAKLNELLSTRQFVPMSLELFAEYLGLPAASVANALKSSFSLAQSWIQAARSRCDNPNADPLLEYYFRISKQPSPSAARGEVTNLYQLMNTFFLRPGGIWGAAAFQPEPVYRGTDKYAWCIPGGFYMGGEEGFIPAGPNDTLYPFRPDTIYYTANFVFMNIEDRAYAIVHELGHFIGRKDDIVYAHKDPVGFLNLATNLRMSNCDNFAMMAYEAGTGKGVPPLLR